MTFCTTTCRVCSPILRRARASPLPHLAALICTSAFDLALHDALGVLLGTDTYRLYGPDLVSRDLASFFGPAGSEGVDFRRRYPAEFFVADPPRRLAAWHLVGGLDPLEGADLGRAASPTTDSR